VYPCDPAGKLYNFTILRWHLYFRNWCGSFI